MRRPPLQASTSFESKTVARVDPKAPGSTEINAIHLRQGPLSRNTQQEHQGGVCQSPYDHDSQEVFPVIEKHGGMASHIWLIGTPARSGPGKGCLHAGLHPTSRHHAIVCPAGCRACSRGMMPPADPASSFRIAFCQRGLQNARPTIPCRDGPRTLDTPELRREIHLPVFLLKRAFTCHCPRLPPWSAPEVSAMQLPTPDP
jgi:hypothetical protein